MKFEYGDAVIYNDDGSFPSLNNKTGIVVGQDTKVGVKYLLVDFVLYNGNTFRASIHKSRFKKVKKIMKDYIFVAIILIMFVALSIIIPLCLIDKKSRHQEKINKKKEEKNKYTYTCTQSDDYELDEDTQHIIDELKRFRESIDITY